MEFSSRKAYIGAVATAVPPYRADQETARDFFHTHYGSRLKLRSLKVLDGLLDHPSIRNRHFALTDPRCLVDEAPDDRIRRFTEWGVDLACEATEKAMGQAGLVPGDIEVLVVNTCTGYLCPGLTSYVIERMGFPRSVKAFDLVGSGCAGALPGMMIGEGQVVSHGGLALCVAVEICSATFQMDDTISLLLSNALFGDGAAAAILWSRPEGLELIGSVTRHLPEERDAIRYIHRQGQLTNQLSTSLPRTMAPVVREAVASLCETRGIEPRDIRHWALHGGGESVITSIGRSLGLDESQLLPTRDILRRFGNMSSPSSLFVLKEILDGGAKPGEWVLLAAFGAGLSAYASLLRMTGTP